MQKTLTKTKKYLSGILLAFFAASVFLPSVAFAVSTQPTTAEPYCFSYKTASGTTVGNTRCSNTMAACISDTSGYTVASACYLSTTPDLAAQPWSAVTNVKDFVKKIGSTITNSVSEAASFLIDQTVGRVLQGIAWLIFTVAGFFLQSMALIMDYSITMTIDSALLGGLAFVNIGWTLIRDFSNMFFIFALLYIAIKTVLGLAGSSTKSWVAHLIIAALLINFSLFLTKVVIDAGNIVAVSFWDKLKVQQGPATINSASAKILQGLNIQTIQTKHDNLNSGSQSDPSHSQMAMIYAGGAIIEFIAGYVFLAGALMMVTRTIVLILLMVFSPFAFLAFALPGGGFSGHGAKWLEALIKQTFVAPLYIFMLYLNSILIDSVDLFKLSGSQGDTLSGALKGDVSSFAIIYNFMLLIGFFIASITIANEYAGKIGGGARAYANKFTRGVAGVTTAATAGYAITRTAGLARDAGGAAGRRLRENERINQMAEQKGIRGAMGRSLRTLGYKAETASFDPRATKIGQTVLSAGGQVNIGRASGAGGYKATGSTLAAATLGARGYVGTDRAKEVAEKAELYHKDKPAVKEAMLRSNLGTVTKTEIDPVTGEKIKMTERAYDTAPQHKELREKIGREKDLSDARKMITEKTKELKTIEADLAKGTLEKEAKEKAERSVSEITEAIGGAMKKLNTNEIADLLPLHATNSAFTANLRKQDLHTIHQREYDGKYAMVSLKDEGGNSLDLLDQVAKGVMSGKNEDSKKYLMSTEGQKKLFNFDAEKYRPTYELEQKTAGRISDVGVAYEAALKENTERTAAASATADTQRAQAAKDLREKMKDIRTQNRG